MALPDLSNSSKLPSRSLRACYAMSGTAMAYAATCLRACYAMSGTDLPYGASRPIADRGY
eukprot:129683-Rhodomonas_salina.1